MKPAFRANLDGKGEGASRAPKAPRAASLDKLQPPAVGKVSHHSIELFWDRPEKHDFKGEDRIKYAIQEEDRKTKGFGTVYVGYAHQHIIDGLEPLRVYKFRLKMSNSDGDSVFSPIISVCTANEPYNGNHLHKAVTSSDQDYLTKILASGEVSIEAADKLGYTPLMNASQRGHLDIIKMLLEHGADVQAQNSSGKTSLMLACFAGNLDVAKRLREAGASWTEVDRGGSSPIHWAVDSGRSDLIEWMLTDGAEVNMQDRNAGWTPLLRCAALTGDVNVARCLIRHGANVNAVDNDGKAPLMIATLNGYMDLAKELVESGAKIETKNKFGKSAMDMAKSFDRRQILSYFEELQEAKENSQTQ